MRTFTISSGQTRRSVVVTWHSLGLLLLCAALAPDGSLAIVGWTDKNTNTAKAAVFSAGAWKRSNLGVGYWAGTVPVAAGNSAGIAGWTLPNLSNPNAGKIVARTWQ